MSGAFGPPLAVSSIYQGVVVKQLVEYHDMDDIIFEEEDQDAPALCSA